MKRTLAGLGLAVLAVAAWIGIDWYRALEADLSAQPPRRSSETIITPHESVVLVNLFTNYSVIEAALSNVADEISDEKSDRERIGCVENRLLRIRECLDVNWTAKYASNGPIKVGHHDSMVRVTVPMKFEGTAGLGGGIARILSLSSKRFDGAIDLSASATAHLDENFCPVLVPGEVSLHWQNEGRVEIIGRTRIGIGGVGFNIGPWHIAIGRHFNEQIRDEMRSELQKASQSIPCDSVRTELVKLWRNFSFPITHNDFPALFVNVEPMDIATSGLSAEESGLRLAAQLRARASISVEKGQETAKGDLPIHKPISPENGVLSLAVPLKVPFEIIQTEIQRVLGDREVVTETAGGEVRLRVYHVEVYPSAEKVAIGVRFAATFPWRLFDTKGTVWFAGEPAVEEGGKVVHLRDLEITRRIDNSLWSVVSAIVRERVTKGIEEAARYDLEADIDRAIAAITDSLSDQSRTAGIEFTLSDPDLRLGKVAVERDGLVVEGLFNSRWDAELHEIRI